LGEESISCLNFFRTCVLREHQAIPHHIKASNKLEAMSKSKQSQNVLILGLTGPPGLQLVGEAIAANWNITLFVRSPEKLTQVIKDSPNVNVSFFLTLKPLNYSSCYRRLIP